MNSDKYWIPNGNFRPRRYRPGGVGNWSGHLPFANDLIADVEPKLLVELGTHYGESYFGFCQAVAENNIPCVCYAIDTWVGEPHAGYYDESVYAEVSSYNAENYSAFSYLLRTTFDEARPNFSEESIDILHIDGLHVYEAVSHDFYSWLPKIKTGGLVLLHDIIGRHGDFGVWKLWEELSTLGSQFAFTHDWGLGIFQKVNTELSKSRLLHTLFDGDKRLQEHIRRFYSLCALKLEHERDPTRGHHLSETTASAQIYPFGKDGYSPEHVYRADIASGSWQRIRIDLLSGIGNGPLRIDFCEQPAIIDLASIAIRKSTNNETLWIVERSADIAALDAASDMTLVDTSVKEEFCRYISWSSDPQFFLPTIDPDGLDQPLYLEIWVRIQLQLSALLALLRSALDDAKGPCEELTELTKALGDVTTERDRLVNEYRALSAERDSAFSAHRKLQGELYVAKSDLKDTFSELQQLRTDFDQSKESNIALENTCQLLRDRCQALEQAGRELQQTISGVLTSRSWRLTAPLRGIASRLK